MKEKKHNLRKERKCHKQLEKEEEGEEKKERQLEIKKDQADKPIQHKGVDANVAEHVETKKKTPMKAVPCK